MVGNDPQRFFALPAQQPPKESFCGVLVPTRLDQNVDYDTVLIDSAPEVVPHPIDL